MWQAREAGDSALERITAFPFLKQNDSRGSLCSCRPLRGLGESFLPVPGAHAPGFMLARAPRAALPILPGLASEKTKECFRRNTPSSCYYLSRLLPGAIGGPHGVLAIRLT